MKTATTLKQTTLFDSSDYSVVPDDWRSDDWETPEQVARFIGTLAQPHEKRICEPAAGRGNIAKHLPNGTTCVELNPLRHMVGAVPHQEWICADFLSYADTQNEVFDLIVGNPPFSVAADFLDAAANIIKDEGRILFLLPSEFFQSQARARALRKAALCITHQWQIVDRVGYEKEGVVCNQRQCYDSVFELRLAEFFLEQVEIVDPYGKLGRAK